MFEDNPDYHPFTGHSTLFVPSYTLLYGKTHLLGGFIWTIKIKFIINFYLKIETILKKIVTN